MSLRKKLADILVEHGELNIDQLMPHLDGFTREQVHKALSNARDAGLILRGKPSKAQGYGKGRKPGTWKPVSAVPSVRSVWELAGVTESMTTA